MIEAFVYGGIAVMLFIGAAKLGGPLLSPYHTEKDWERHRLQFEKIKQANHERFMQEAARRAAAKPSPPARITGRKFRA